MGETDATQGTVNDVIYNLWAMKEPNYLTRMMVTGDRLLADDTCNEIRVSYVSKLIRTYYVSTKYA